VREAVGRSAALPIRSCPPMFCFVLLYRVLLFGRRVPSQEELMVCEDRRSRDGALSRIGHGSLIAAAALIAVLWKSSHPAVVAALGLNILDALFGRWTFQQLYFCGLPGFSCHGLTVLRKYVFPALNVATLLYLLTGHAAFCWSSLIMSGTLAALLLGLGLSIGLFFKPYSCGLAARARATFKEHAGPLTPIAVAYCDGMQRGFCFRRMLPTDGSRPIEVNPRRFEVAKQLEDHYATIKAEVVEAMESHPRLFHADYGYSENAAGQWKSFHFVFHTGRRLTGEEQALYREARTHLPHTTKLLSALHEDHQIAGEAFLSILMPGAVLRPHRDYVAGTRTVHLGLLVPPRCALRVGGEPYTWKEGECVVFDASFLHDARNDSDRPRVVLLADICEPAWTLPERIAVKAFKTWKAGLTVAGMLKVTALGMRARIAGNP
jgi:hypothetical protein